MGVGIIFDEFLIPLSVRSHNLQHLHLKAIYCPGCHKARNANDLKLLSKTQYSNIRCEKCSEVSNANLCSCECGMKWRKCNTHELYELEPQTPATAKPRRRALRDLRGIEAHFPKFRKGNFDHECFGIEQAQGQVRRNGPLPAARPRRRRRRRMWTCACSSSRCRAWTRRRASSRSRSHFQSFGSTLDFVSTTRTMAAASPLVRTEGGKYSSRSTGRRRFGNRTRCSPISMNRMNLVGHCTSTLLATSPCIESCALPAPAQCTSQQCLGMSRSAH